MSIIDNTYFQQGKLKLPLDNITDWQFYIDENEPDILKDILGYESARDFQSALAGTPDQKWVDLRDGKEYTDTSGYLQKYEGIFYIIADYVFFKIIENKQDYPTDSGVKRGLTDNAEIADPKYKQVAAWSDMVERIKSLDEFVEYSNNLDSTTYPNYNPTDVGRTNVLNI